LNPNRVIVSCYLNRVTFIELNAYTGVVMKLMNYTPIYTFHNQTSSSILVVSSQCSLRLVSQFVLKTLHSI